ncbi:Glutamate--tRNA ligase protein [Marine Group I thaumarchaeote SCGC RSA3]|uniref:Glutamate--tRNA ligase n=6 Tax=Marine Group I TaxID=905826 RepID=A0A081RPQ9_9ARCH|nr:Glutamate--tRNA ligase protein [Marine Group I thaumarchaeote SCGC AAA799-N04]KFM17167.1 Glutamate--tRNA ligase protein [Marine Group I thaumarchaeote SCGC AAA799-D11]KFM19025.1 Glutamate--tRNA ligase protein [Marine Group I thaumarchaeote SCGC RSA3]
MDEEIKKEIRKMALQNAFEHGGQTQDKIVLGKILGTKPEFRTKVKEISGEISEIVASVNQLSQEQQQKELEENFPDALVPKEKVEEREGLPELKNAEQGKVVTRFPPEPNGYPHIGHAKAAIINSEYAKMYGGKFILRMDDTNPEAERMEYHAAIKVGLEWLGIEFDQVKNTSDDMEIFYEKGMELINSGKAYVCTCKREDISKNRRERKVCKCSMEDIGKNNKNWEKMQNKFKPGEAIVRFRGDMKADNAVMRDPVLLRIIDEKHYTVGDKYRIWPSYDFAVAIEDSIDGVTHAFRSKEFELRKELIDTILDALGMRKPQQGFFSRLEFKGMPISKRIIKPLIEEGKVSWYDDPRLPTLEALRRRGIKPEAIRKFIMSLGLTKANTLAPFDALEAFNRKFVDADSMRLFMVKNAKKLKIKNLPTSVVEIPNHPINDMGKRKIEITEDFYISGDDAELIKEQTSIRLLGLGNVKITKVSDEFEGEFVGEGDSSNIPKIQWVPQKTAHEIKMIVPKILFNGEEFNEESLEELDVYTEPQYLQLKEGEEIQFVRFGYCRKDSQNQAIFTHK